MKIEFVDEQDDPLQPGHAVEAALVNIARTALTAEGLPDHCEMSLTLVGDVEMARLNEAYMGKSGPTDVLSFPIEDMAPGSVPVPDPQGPPLLVGDVVICPPVVAANAERAQVAFDDELALMVVHGVLHLLGYDHVVDAEAEEMEERERQLLEALGLVRP